MARPVVSQAAEDLYAILKPLAFADEQNDWPLLKYCEANAGLLQEVLDYTSLNGTPPWSAVVDIDRAPFKALPWLGQLAGQLTPNRLPGETDLQYEDRLRQYIRDTPGFRRGSPGAMAAAAQQFLTGSKTVYFHERDTSAYHLTVNTRRNETPVEDWPSTNLFGNGSAETNDFGFSGTNTNILRVSTQFHHGLWSIQLVPLAAGDIDTYGGGGVSGASAGRIFTASGWIKATLSQIGKTGLIFCGETGGASGNAYTQSTPIILTGAWQKITATRIFVQNDRTGVQFVMRCVSPTLDGSPVFVDEIQVEEQPVATPYIHTDGGPASRTAGNGPVGAALRAQKPGGIVMVYNVITGQDWQHVVDTYASWTAVGAAYATIDALEAG